MIEKELQEKRKEAFKSFLILHEMNELTDEMRSSWAHFEAMVNTAIYTENLIKFLQERGDAIEPHDEVLKETHHGALFFHDQFMNMVKELH